MSTTTEVLASAENSMKKAIADLEKELQTVRTGRANPGLLDRVEVEYYGTPTPLKSLVPTLPNGVDLHCEARRGVFMEYSRDWISRPNHQHEGSVPIEAGQRFR